MGAIICLAASATSPERPTLNWPDKKAWVKSEEEFDKKQTREVLAEYHSRIAKAENVKYVPRRPLTSAPDRTRRAFGCLPLACPWNPSEKGFYSPTVCVIAG